MTRQRKLKRRVRAVAAETGVPYSAARAKLLAAPANSGPSEGQRPPLAHPAFARCHWLTDSRVVVVPDLEAGEIQVTDLEPDLAEMRSFATELSTRCSRPIEVDPAMYFPISVSVSLLLSADIDESPSVDRVLADFLSPVVGGRDHDGWPFGAPVHASDLKRVLEALPTVDEVSDVLLRQVDLERGRFGPYRTWIDLPAPGLPFGWRHDVRRLA